MRKFTLVVCVVALLASTLRSETFQNYYSRYPFLMAPSSTFQNGLVGFVNPANLAMVKKFETKFWWNTDGTDAASFNDWGIFAGSRILGFGALRHNMGNFKVTDYRFSSGFGADDFSLGLSYGWSSGDTDILNREKELSIGSIFRPFRYLSLGLLGNFSVESDAKFGVAEIGIRPFGTPRLTLFADGALNENTKLKEAPWSAGAALNLASGINLVGRIFENDAVTVGLTIDFGKPGIASQLHFNEEQNHAQNSYLVRVGAMKPSIFPPSLQRNQRYLSLSMRGNVDYLSYVLFDDSVRLLDVLTDIQAASNDPRIKVIAMNLSAMRIRPEHAWEVREELKKASEKGKKILIFMENAGMTSYHLASIAHKIVIDPQGSVMLPGFLLGRTYFKGTLEKLGLGFDEWRFFKYKSAAEALSRREMSEADREQRQAYVDDWYELVRTDVSANRNFSGDEFDQLVNEQIFFLAQEALKRGLVDTLGRWTSTGKIIEHYWGVKPQKTTGEDLLDKALDSQQWGRKPQIAVVYALGICAMDEGIRARWLSKKLLQLKEADAVKAIVLRVDSPGGDGMASDVVAEAIKKCKQNKPVIISQGQVAGSGGYWISMYGDQIVAGPSTVTGSIGVIGGWIYDKGIGKKTGMTSDYVKRGDHADLGFGISLPFINANIPARNLTQEEREKVENIIRRSYNMFVKKVAEGRGLSIDKVKQIAQGHFYSGLDGQEVGLVDEIGSLLKAIAIAKIWADIEPDEDVEIIEIPESKGFVNLPSFFSTRPVMKVKDHEVFQYIKMITQQPGKPLPLMIPGTYPTIE